MKRIVKLTILLSLFVQFGFAQTVKTEEEYKVIYDSIVSRLTLAEKDANDCIEKPFPKLVELLDKYGMKIIRVQLSNCDYQKLYPQEVFGISLTFTTDECYDFARTNDLQQPYIIINFIESKPYEKASDLVKKYQGRFTKEVEEFYSDAVMKSIGFYFMDDMYSILYKTKKEKEEKEKNNK